MSQPKTSNFYLKRKESESSFSSEKKDISKLAKLVFKKSCK